nr:gas vesicle protein GvpD [Candidatus Sigynarchaeota archaeon]
MPTTNYYIPPELLKMLELPYGYSLLLKGEGGVGKSTLALELLVKSKGKNATYISTRVSPSQLFEHFPWIQKDVEESFTVLDATQAGTTMNNPLDEGEQLALKFMGMPDLLQSIVHMAEQASGQLFVVIDSWDAIQLMFEHLQAQKYADKPQMTENLNFMYNVFMSLVRQKNIKLILVAENASMMDYLVDGVVELRREFLPNTKMVRIAELKKFRGIRITNTSYLFSLEEGRFKAFFPWDVELVKDFRGSLVKLEYDEKTLHSIVESILLNQIPMQMGALSIDDMHKEFINIVIDGLARFQLKRNEMFTFTPPDNFDILMFKNKMLSYLEKEDIDPERYYKNIRIHLFDIASDQVRSERNVVDIPIPDKKLGDQEQVMQLLNLFAKKISSYGTEGNFKHSINIGYLLPFETKIKNLDIAANTFFSTFSKLFKIPNSIFIMATNSSDKFIQEIYKMANFCVDISFFQGTPLMNVISPHVPSLFGFLIPPDQEPQRKKLYIHSIV